MHNNNPKGIVINEKMVEINMDFETNLLSKLYYVANISAFP